MAPFKYECYLARRNQRCVPLVISDRRDRAPPVLRRDIAAFLNNSDLYSLSIWRNPKGKDYRTRTTLTPSDFTLYWVRLHAVTNARQSTTGYMYRLFACPLVETPWDELSRREYRALLRRREHLLSRELPAMLPAMTETLERAFYVDVGEWRISEYSREQQRSQDCEEFDRYGNDFWAIADCDLRSKTGPRPLGDALDWFCRGPPNFSYGRLDILFHGDEHLADRLGPINGLERLPDEEHRYRGPPSLW